MDTKCLLELILIFVLQFEAGISGGDIFLYNRPGEDVILPCGTASPSDPTCSNVLWFYDRDRSQTFIEVQNGNVRESSARADRLSVDTNCSLVINIITAEDAGLYTCRQGRRVDQDASVFLSVLTVSPSPPDADPRRDGEVTLECSLLTHSNLLPCELNSIRWLDETGTVLRGDGVGNSSLRQMKCVSSLTVKRQSGHNRKYTCQLLNEQNNVEIQADYTPDFTDPTVWSPLSYVMLALRIAGLILMIVITALLIRHTWNKKTLDDDNEVENDGDVQYENVEARGSPAAAAAAPAAATTTTTTTTTAAPAAPAAAAAAAARLH
ncbi:uncharacterized protein LOC119476889 [Sebastes umbrosus]|uniref:uncharacterized protein LOC119476889 n=1 Tax=Sebastes umbrosus TaxID=72105 RepID=UPI00189D35E8|nr:uncharacterized protein LOC119476889 [Sebastes umbrosus]